MEGMDPNILSLYADASKLWYVDPMESPISSDYLKIVRKHIDPAAIINRMTGWISVRQHGEDEIHQGWKIHISAVHGNAEAVLDRASAVFAEELVDFKFQADPQWLAVVNNRMTPRGNGCKFITAYPTSESRCRELLDKLYEELKSFRGPRILSDRRYRDCEVLHYRYGGHLAIFELNVNGSRQGKIRNPQTGELVDDRRLPYWSLPPWVDRDPFSEVQPDAFAELVLAERFRVESAMRFTNSGGIYIGTDLQTGAKVLIKEGRYGTDTVPKAPTDAIAMRRNEWEVLSLLKGTGASIEPVAFFMQEGHAFLVTEYLEDVTHLGGFTSGRHPMQTLDETGYEAYFRDLIHIWGKVAEYLDILHRENIVYGDLSMTNILLMLGEEDALPGVRLIDFESSVPAGGTDAPSAVTVGFAPLNLREDRVPRLSNDVFSLGMIMLGCLFIGTEPSIQDRRQLHKLLANLQRDLPMPAGLVKLIEDMTVADPDQRIPLSEVRQRLGLLKASVPTESGPARPRIEDGIDLRRVVSGISFAATPGRSDRCYASDPMLYQTNPLSVAYGVAGVMRALSYTGSEAGEEACSWLLQRSIDPEECPPGLYIGLAGVAWSCLDFGLDEYAQELMAKANRHPLVGRSTDLFHGDAGLALANLHFWERTADATYLETAARLGARVGAAAVASQPDLFGFGGGASGMATAMLYTGKATGDDEAVAAGLSLVRDCIAHARRTPTGYRSMPARRQDKDAGIVSPYWMSGTAGVAGAALRFAAAHPDEDLLDFVDDAVIDAGRKYAFMPGYLSGLAGMGDFLLDVHAYTGRPDALEGARSTAAGLALFAREEGEHLLFPGSQLLRHSADFATGSAGIAMFLHRLRAVESLADPGPVQLLPESLLQPSLHGTSSGAGDE